MENRILLLDGGLGTTLEDIYGIKFTQETPLWSSHLLIHEPNILCQAQHEFAVAGSDIILTPTYQASHIGFRKTRADTSDAEIANYFRLAVDISRSTKCLVALSLGAYGAILQPSQEYTGEYGGMNESDLIAFHRERLAAFNLADVDIIAFETLPRLDEIRAVKQVVDGSKPYWISCVFREDTTLPDRSTVEEVLATMMAEPRPWGIGMNCVKVRKVSDMIQKFESVAKSMHTRLPRLILYPDGTNGQVYDTALQIWVGEEEEGGAWHEKMAQIIQEVESRGLWEGIVVGGCCKTGPNHIKQLRQSLIAARLI